jgi:hypothetical protein
VEDLSGKRRRTARRPDAAGRHFLDFRHASGDSMDVLYGDYSVRSPKYKIAATTWTQYMWDNNDKF